MKHFAWHALQADDTATRRRWRCHCFEPQSGSVECAGFQMLTDETVLRNGVSLARFRMRKPLDAAHT